MFVREGSHGMCGHWIDYGANVILHEPLYNLWFPMHLLCVLFFCTTFLLWMHKHISGTHTESDVIALWWVRQTEVAVCLRFSYSFVIFVGMVVLSVGCLPWTQQQQYDEKGGANLSSAFFGEKSLSKSNWSWRSVWSKNDYTKIGTRPSTAHLRPCAFC